jgi:PAS domain S-box-containing protein
VYKAMHGNQPARILIVEDEEAHAELMSRSFEDANGSTYAVTVAGTLREARHSLDRVLPDLVVADFLLPDGKGIELAHDLRIAGRVPLILMTSHGNEQIAVDAIKAGAIDYVVKSDSAFLDMPRTAERTLREWGHIRERKRAEEELQEREAELSAIYDNAPLIMLLVDADLCIRKANVAALQFTGRSARSVVGSRGGEVLGCIHGLDDPQGCGLGPFCEQCTVRRAIRDTLETGRSHTQEEASLTFSVSGQPEEMVFLLSTARLIVRNQPMVLLSMLDITERKRVEDALRQSEERFRTVFDSAEEIMFIKDRSLRFTHVNPALCRLMGLAPSKLVGKRAQEVYAEDAARFLEERENRVLAGESIETETKWTVRGTPMTFQEMLSPLRNSKNNIIGVCGIVHDVTSRRRPVAELREGHEYPSPAMQDALRKALIAANTDSIVLLQGESGSGKDFLARWLHDRSRRANGPFFSINCAALPRELAESELFGHERGAFTGAAGLKKGMLELAEGGTILLNEIGELELSIQSKLLTFLDTQSFVRVGGQKRIKVNARLIAATHRDLQTETSKGRFLEPLFYRVNVFPLHVPPLRERVEDIPVLTRALISKLVIEMQLQEIPRIEPHDMELMARYQWPGNVRELRNVLERSLILWTGGPLDLVIPAAIPGSGEWCYTVRFVPGKNLREVTCAVETSLCTEVLRRCKGNKKETARLLDISRDTLYRLIKKSERTSDD